MAIFRNAKAFAKGLIKKILPGAIGLRVLDVEKAFIRSREEFLQYVKSHPVSRAIEGENNGVYSGRGSLKGFLGLEGDGHVNNLISFLKENLKQNHRVVGDFVIVSSVHIPSVSDYRENSLFQLPWESGQSWLEAVENGVNNYANYVSVTGAGRSGEGFQVKSGANDTSSGLRPTPYPSDFSSQFRKIMAKNLNRFR